LCLMKIMKDSYNLNSSNIDPEVIILMEVDQQWVNAIRDRI